MHSKFLDRLHTRFLDKVRSTSYPKACSWLRSTFPDNYKEIRSHTHMILFGTPIDEKTLNAGVEEG
jgi:hypothetical protein